MIQGLGLRAKAETKDPIEEPATGAAADRFYQSECRPALV